MSFFQKVRALGLGAVASLSLGVMATTSSAAVYPEFSLDLGASSVSIGESYCFPRCQVSTGLNTGLANNGDNLDFTFGGLGESLELPNLIEWAISGTGVGAFTLALELVFTSPDEATGSTSGVAKIGTFFGILTKGRLAWSNPNLKVAFDQGSVLNVALQDGYFVDFDRYGRGGKLAAGATITPHSLTALETPSPVPLPAALPALLVLVLGGLGFGWKRRREEAALA